LIVGEDDEQMLEFNRSALAQPRCENQLAIVPAATYGSVSHR
jgi:hypothetical protein